MSYFLHGWELKTATENIQCQASEMLFSYFRQKDIRLPTIWEVSVMIKYFEKIIEPECQYLCFTFVDEEGEMYEFNCRLDVNKLMIKKHLYPLFMEEAIVNYKLNFKR